MRNISCKSKVLVGAAGILGCAVLMFHVSPQAQAQTITMDTSTGGQRQLIDGFGTCLSGSEALQTWWQNLYFGDLQASMLRMDLSPAFAAPYSDNNYNSPNYGVAGPGGNYVRAYTNATTYTNLFDGLQAQIAVMGPNIDSNIAYFNFSAGGPQVAGATAQMGQSLITRSGDFKLFGSHWSPAPWVKIASGNTYNAGGT
ncbi:MAG TPA: hypothetical protein VK731_04695, partial [Candidatus Cybelea sp.]|nr:hypothetical protein [Candidatus Cybelea sp.]